MSVVHLFGQRKQIKGEETSQVLQESNDNAESAEVIELIVNKRIAHGVPAKTIYKQLEAMMVSHGVDFSCGKTKKDFKIVTYLVQGIYDRQAGQSTSSRSFLGDVLRDVFEGDSEADTNDTNALFGDLLGRLD